MTYSLTRPDTPVIGGVSAADAATGWRPVMIPYWQATSTSGAATASDGAGDGFGVNPKWLSFSATATKYAQSGMPPFLMLPDAGIKTARVRFIWGARGAGAGNVVWKFWALQPAGDRGTGLIAAGADDMTEVSATSTSAVPGTVDQIKSEVISLTLSGLTAARPTMFALGRMGAEGTDTLGVAALVYGIQVEAK